MSYLEYGLTAGSYEQTPYVLQAPFLYLQGAEILQNMQTTQEESSNLEGKIRHILRLLLTPKLPSNDRVVVVGIMGPNGSGKGGIGSGIVEAYHQLGIEEIARGKGFETELLTSPFAHYPMAAKLNRAVEEGYIPKEEQIPQEYFHGTFKPEHYRTGSVLGWEIIRRNILEKRQKNKQVLLVVEASNPYAYPVTAVPPVVEEGGLDRGLSTIDNLAFHPDTRDDITIFAVERHRLVPTTEAIEHRSKLNDSGSGIHGIFEGDERYIYYDTEGNLIDLGESKDANLQKAAKELMRISVASPQAILRSEREMREVHSALSARGLVANMDDPYLDLHLYYGFRRAEVNKLRGQLGENIRPMTTANFITVASGVMLGPKTYDLRYYIDHNIIARTFPDLIPQPLRNSLT